MRKVKRLLPTKERFLILTNGKETEVNYFTLLKQRKSPYKVEIKFLNESPRDLVESAKEYVKTYNQVWCVFDIEFEFDKIQLIEAIIKARRSGVNIAYSNLCFEVYLIYHFECLYKYCNTKELNEILNDYLKRSGSLSPYTKSDIRMLEKHFIPYYRTAINNSKLVYQRRMTNDNSENNIYPFRERNSSSNVFMLVEALRLEK